MARVITAKFLLSSPSGPSPKNLNQPGLGPEIPGPDGLYFCVLKQSSFSFKFYYINYHSYSFNSILVYNWVFICDYYSFDFNRKSCNRIAVRTMMATRGIRGLSHTQTQHATWWHFNGWKYFYLFILYYLGGKKHLYVYSQLSRCHGYQRIFSDIHRILDARRQ
jgi:hypothetical protein